MRLAGLGQGAKLELVQLSKSPSVVNVALQVPESEARGVPNGRLTDKFPSTTTLWMVLRKFEAGVAGGNGTERNLTARGAPAVTSGGDRGAGRLYYQMPVVQAMGRELASFEDLQKTLAQLGFNRGNVLLRLSFRTTEEPLEVAMEKISKYFESAETETVGKQAESQPTQEQPAAAEPAAPSAPAPEPTVASAPAADASEPATSTATSSEAATGRPVTVYRPPSGTTPQSALAEHNEEDYVPTIEHARTHQERLSRLSRNTKLLSDKELAEKAAAEEQKLAAITSVDVKIRFPEQSQVVTTFGTEDTGASLYAFVRSCLAEAYRGEAFVLTTSTITGPGGSKTIPDDDRASLIRNIGLRGRVLVTFSWADPAARQRAAPKDLLKAELRRQAQDIQIPAIAGPAEESEEEDQQSRGKGKGVSLGALTPNDDKDKKGASKGVPKWLKLPGKK